MTPPQQTAAEPNIERRLFWFGFVSFALGWLLAGLLEWAGAAAWVALLMLVAAFLGFGAGVGPLRRRLYRVKG